MSINPEIRDRAYQFYVAEAPELLNAIEASLLALREDASIENIHNMMRAAHSLKGGAASVGLNGIKDIAHRLEDIFKALYHTDIAAYDDLEGQLLQAYDCLQKPLRQQLERGHYDAEAAAATAEPIFQQIEALLGDAYDRVDDFIPNSEDLGVDMAASIFEVDVRQSLDLLAEAIVRSDASQLAEELCVQAEVLAGLGEIVGSIGFQEIAGAAVAALEARPEQVKEIARLALQDWEAGRQVFLAGDRTQAGRPSAGLQAFSQIPGVVAPVADDFEEGPSGGGVPLPATDESFEARVPAAAGMPSVEDIFGTPTIAEPGSIAEPENVARPSAEDIFGAELLSAGMMPPPDFPATATDPPASDAQAAEAIAALFESLPVADDPTAARVDARQVLKKDAQKAPEPTARAAATVRVNLDRLERMDNQVGELASNWNRLAVQNEQLQGGLRELRRRFQRFQELSDYLRDVADKLLVSSGLQSERLPYSKMRSIPMSQMRIDAVELQDGFDAIELDQYGTLSALLQELLEQTAQIDESVGDVSLFALQSSQALGREKKMLEQLRDELMWARMLPIGDILTRFPRMLRDLSLEHDKPTTLKLAGTHVRVDKEVLEKLYDPLLHLVRNAFDHGIEPVDARRLAGKPAEGQIEIRAYYQGNQTVIEVRDDGCGISAERIRQKAVEIAGFPAEVVAPLDDRQLFELLFEPGFSTAERVSDLSGRGVGLDVVRSEVEALKGSIELNSVPGRGTTFSLRLPFTLSVAKLLICMADSAIWALPSDSIEEIAIPMPNQVKYSGSQRFLYLRDRLIPIYRLADVLEYNCPPPSALPNLKALGAVPAPSDWLDPLLLMRRGQQVFALEISQLVTEQDLVIKPFGGVLEPPAYIYGCTILGDGSLVPVLDALTLYDELLDPEQAPTAIPFVRGESVPITPPPQAYQTPTLLVVDDSAVQRQTLTLTFERVGYRVLHACDGREAIAELEKNNTIQAIVCDVEMPNMNGFEFLRFRRHSPKIASIPTIMLTSRSSEKHRKLAMHLGANDYFTKPYLEKEFVTAVEKLVRVAVAEGVVQ